MRSVTPMKAAKTGYIIISSGATIEASMPAINGRFMQNCWIRRFL